MTLTRKEHVQKVEQRIDYLNSVDTTIMGSRNGQAALYMWCVPMYRKAFLTEACQPFPTR